MTTAKQLIEYLEKLPPDTKIEVLKTVSKNYDTYTTFEDLNLHPYDGNCEMFWTDNTLQLGET